MRGGDAEEGSECCVSDAPTVEAEDEFIEKGLEVLAAADDMGIVGDAGSAEISGPTIRPGGRAGGDIGGEKGVQAGGRVISDLAEADAAEAKPGPSPPSSASTAPTTSILP